MDLRRIKHPLNLCLNARDAMRHEGELIVSAENLEMSAEEGAGFRPKSAPGRYVVVTVCDSGEGMPIEVQTRLFEPFFTTKAEGRGNGLVRCRRRCGSWN